MPACPQVFVSDSKNLVQQHAETACLPACQPACFNRALVCHDEPYCYERAWPRRVEVPFANFLSPEQPQPPPPPQPGGPTNREKLQAPLLPKTFALAMPSLLRIVPLVTVLLPFVAAQSCQTTLGGNCGDSSRPRDKNCCTVGYCQPWNSGYYQCLDVPAKCPVQETDIDYYGNDLQTIYGIQPWDCCEKCSTTSGCAAYTFVNQNPDGKTACYLKTSVTGRVEKKGAVSAAYKDYVAPNCTTALWGQCGSAKSSSCCPNNAYCQPWNTGYYQCITTPSKCPTQETDIDYYGNDLQTIYGIQPGDCCEKCSATVGCAGYTFVNENPDGKTACYLKKSIAGRVAKKGAVSAAYTGPAPTCTAKVGDGCGNLKSGSTCCPSGSFCQPWNQYYYQCVANPPAAKCPQILVGVDFYGDDLRTEYNLVPDTCCDACYKDANCKAFTYVNENADGRSTCYLKKGKGTQQALAKAISGVKA